MKFYDIGQPFETEAIVNFEDITQVDDIETLLDKTKFEIEIDEQVTLTYKLQSEDQIYGLGENMRGINKRGGIYESFCTDDPSHQPDRKALYGAHNFFVVDTKDAKIGCFIDFPTKVELTLDLPIKMN